MVRNTLAAGLLGIATVISAAAQTSESKPLTALPYTPSLDVSAMDKSADPCVNFYQYSCGGWIKKNPIPNDQARWNVYAKLNQENQQFLWGMLLQASQPSAGRSAAQQKIGDYFQSCMDEAAVDKSGLAPLQKKLDQLKALTSKAELSTWLAGAHKVEAGGMFGFGSNQDFGDATKVIAFAGAGGLGLPDRDYYTKTDTKSEETRKRYVEHVGKMFTLLGDAPETAASEARQVMEIETALAKASLTRVEQRDPHKLYHKFTRAQLQELMPDFAWAPYLKELGISSVDDFNVTEPEFFRELDHQLSTRDLAMWKTYLRWHLAHSAAPYLSKAFEQANFEFYRKYLLGINEERPRWKRCVQYVDRDLGEALGQIFVEKAFTPKAKQETDLMTKEIERAMEQELKQLPWMTAKTKDNALTKLHSIVNKIGYPDKWRDYSAVSIVRGDFTGNVMNARAFEFQRGLDKIGKPVDRGEWQMTPPTVNAYYDPQMNDINFPAGVLQPPLFDPKMDDAPNYGNTGATIGHELTHGFDDEGRQFDAQGNLKDWWNKDDADQFERKAQCVVDQYAQYTVVEDIKINSKLTLGEDLADLGGTWLAYLAWKHVTEGKKLESRDGLTPDQRFFIGMAQWACGDERAESKRSNAITNPHSPEEYRINGVVVNLPQFGSAFACKAGQPMVKEKVCKVW